MHILCHYPKICNFLCILLQVCKNMQLKKLIEESTYYVLRITIFNEDCIKSNVEEYAFA